MKLSYGCNIARGDANRRLAISRLVFAAISVLSLFVAVVLCVVWAGAHERIWSFKVNAERPSDTLFVVGVHGATLTLGVGRHATYEKLESLFDPPSDPGASKVRMGYVRK